MKFKENMTTKQKVEALERMILVHSMLYYHMDTNIISDKRYDKLSRLLAEKLSTFSEKKIRSTQYGYVFYDFDGDTGFDLIDRLTKEDRKRIKQVATCVLSCYRREARKR